MENDFEKELSARNTLSVELVAAYIRVSTTEQKLHGISLDAQIAKLKKYAEEHNMKIVEWYKDEGVSGRKLIKNRPELQRMIHDAEEGKFDRIIFIKLDRFFRSVAEYHECMKRITPVVWTTTDEEYDLTTANGRMLVNMKLTIAEMEADLAGERINLVNEYKLSVGQPLTGSQPFGFKIANDEKTGRKKVIRDPDVEEALRETIDFYLKHQSRKKALVFLNTKYHVGLGYNALKLLFANPMLYGALKDNPNYCEAYVDKETFNKIQEISKRNIKMNTAWENGIQRHYIFSGLLICPECGSKLKGTISSDVVKGKRYTYKRYRCGQRHLNSRCAYNKSISENVFERLLLAQVEDDFKNQLDKAKILGDAEDAFVPKYDIEEIYDRMDRLNYSWQTGKIRKVETYEKAYAELEEELEAAKAELNNVPVIDFSNAEHALQDGWKEYYTDLTDERKRAFWRKFIKSIEVDWDKKIAPNGIKFY